MNTTTLDTKFGSLWYVVLEQYVQGATSPIGVSHQLGLKEESALIRRIINDPDFGRAVWDARRDPAETAVRKIKQNLLTYASEMHKIAIDGSDKRSQVTALKDLMDRGGMGAAQKIDIKSPSAYKDAVKDLTEDPPALLEENPVEPVEVEVTE